MQNQRESMEFDVLIIGAGPAGLSAAIELKKKAQDNNHDIEVCVLEKGSEVGSHIISGAILETSSLDILIPDWKELDIPIETKVKEDHIYYLTKSKSYSVPKCLAPKTMHNHSNYIISLGSLCRFLAEYAENMGIHIFPGFAATHLIYNDGQVVGVQTGDMGLDKDSSPKETYIQGIDIFATYTLLAEGCRGHLGKEVIQKYQLSKDKDPQHYGIGIKELWQLPKDKHNEGVVIHTTGWPLSEHGATGGGFAYYFSKDLLSIGLITDLSYDNPYLSPFYEMQRFKTHPKIAPLLEGAKRIGYGARAIVKGGIQSQPEMTFPGGLLIGDDAGTLNFAKIKGTHTAMYSGILAANVVYKALSSKVKETDLSTSFKTSYEASSLYKELYLQRNFGPAQHKWGNLLGSAYAFFDINLFSGRTPWTMRNNDCDHYLKEAKEVSQITYDKPDNKLTFDRSSSVFLSNVYYEENQPIHLKIENDQIPIEFNLKYYDEPATKYCPAGVYEIVEKEGQAPILRINATNCIHCKTCDIKDMKQNIKWTPSEGGSGPNYNNL